VKVKDNKLSGRVLLAPSRF